METVITTGTSLEVLAPYLPYGIEVEMLTESVANTKGEHAKLASLNAHHDHRARVCWADGNLGWFPVREMLPILRPFSQLCDPLPDGTVPAVEVAKMWPECGEYNFEGATASLENGGKYLLVKHANGATLATLYQDEYWGECVGLDTALAILAYLHSHHFAVGLAPSQFVAK